MSDSGAPPPAQDSSPQVVVKKRRISIVWIIPIVVIMSGAVASAILGESLRRDGRARFQGSELLDLPD